MTVDLLVPGVHCAACIGTIERGWPAGQTAAVFTRLTIGDGLTSAIPSFVISIAAALHAAYACPSTRYIDLDGSFDLATDPTEGGFAVEDGMLKILDRPGLGVHCP